MEFEVHTYAPTTAETTALQVHSFKAHRVIVAARCEWFKKALMSGMQESINRKVVITDTSPVIFRRLLLYLYGAPIDRTVGAEQVCELMLLADRYSIDDLKVNRMWGSNAESYHFAFFIITGTVREYTLRLD